ncbi:MAG: hypothetical protein US59_C0036G0013 [Candidatus Levybacteria bacterium GW2011_GWB1_37_8]|nr:MAG: hypothetical protein US55_C0011G0011 [Candidatus Levybacteria bacterium GW2011_GWC2_37_7]KKQ41315.1 MAG: hypothetical protein US59_C0036G0013 [Candidatus Levybacteria bacterium GW2011_GWB1_37_8]
MSEGNKGIQLDHIFERGVHTEEKRLLIKSIPATIVDSHNEVLGLWSEIENSPAVLVHIDKHDDMIATAPTLAHAKSLDDVPWFKKLDRTRIIRGVG